MGEIRAHVTVPEDVQDLFQWFVKFDPRFGGSPAAVAAHLVRVGVLTLYRQGLNEATPLPDEVAKSLAAASRGALEQAVDVPVAPARKRRAG
jgi:hypothetical protein